MTPSEWRDLGLLGRYNAYLILKARADAAEALLREISKEYKDNAYGYAFGPEMLARIDALLRDDEIASCAVCGAGLELVRPGKWQHIGECSPDGASTEGKQ